MTDNKITLSEDETAMKAQETRSANLEDDDDDYVEFHFQEKPHNEFSWATLTYMWLISSWFMTTMGIFLMQKVLPKFYGFDPLSAKTSVFQDSSLDLIGGTLYIFGAILVGYYIVGRNKPYWMNPKNLCEGKGLLVFFLGLLIFKSLIGGLIFSIVPSTVKATDDTFSAFTEFSSFKMAFDPLTGKSAVDGYPSVTKQMSLDSLECKRREKAVLDLVKTPMSSPTAGLMRRGFVIDLMSSGCLSMADGYEIAKEMKDRSLAIRYPHQYFLEFIKPDFKKIDRIVPDKVMFSTRDWCYILVAKDSAEDKKVENMQLCQALSSESLTALPKETSFEQFYDANKNKSE